MRTLSLLFFLCTLTNFYTKNFPAEIEIGYTQKFPLYSQSYNIQNITLGICAGLAVYVTGYYFWNYFKIKQCELCLNSGPSRNQKIICNNGHKLCIECITTLKVTIAANKEELLDESYLTNPYNNIPQELMQKELSKRDSWNKLKQCPFGPAQCSYPLLLE